MLLTSWCLGHIAQSAHPADSLAWKLPSVTTIPPASHAPCYSTILEPLPDLIWLLGLSQLGL